MKPGELEKYVDVLLKTAIKKCGNLDEAQELCQETLLAALQYISNGKEINDIKAWLSGVLNHKYYDALRIKYKLPTVSIDNAFEIAGENEIDSVIDTDEADELRRQIAYLSRIYREVIVRHYFNGDSVEDISSALNIPAGTVKSRLETDLAKAIGIPSAYVESIIDTLVHNELMKRVGNKVYTDFIIYSHHDTEKNIEPQRKLINNNFDIFWKPLQSGLDRMRNTSFYMELSKQKKPKLEYYFLMHALSRCFFGAGSRIYDGRHDYPERPNGGRWIGMGYSYPQDYDHENSEIHKYFWSGERTNNLFNNLNTKEITLKVFDTPLEKQHYYHTKNNLKDDGIAQILFIINEGIEPSSTGIDPLYFENIPYLAECGLLDIINGKPVVDIPILIKDEYDELDKITNDVMEEFIPSALNLLSEHLRNAKAKLPPHLKSVPEQKQYLEAMTCLHMFVIFRAMEEGLIFTDVDYPCPPMVLIIDR